MNYLRSVWVFSALALLLVLPAWHAHAQKDVLLLLRGTPAHPFNQQLLQGLYSANAKLTAPYHLEVQYTASRFNSDYSPAWDRYYQALEGLRGERNCESLTFWAASVERSF